jgi:hypothetical protein
MFWIFFGNQVLKYTITVIHFTTDHIHRTDHELNRMQSIVLKIGAKETLNYL